MGDGRNRKPQMTTRMDPVLREQAVRIAELNHERDHIGSGASVVVRRALQRYVRKHQHLLDDYAADSSS